MSRSEQKIVQYLNEAHATELALVRVLQSQIAMTPHGSYRTGIEKHLGETRDHAERVQRRLGELGQGANPLQVLGGFAETVIGQALAVAKTPVDLLRGSNGEEKVLKNAKDACATEALEIATYTSLEQLAKSVGDERTAKLAASIRKDEGKAKGAVASESDLAIAGYDKLTAEEIVGKLSELSQIDLAKVDSYERRHENRATVLGRISSLRGDEPWPGYDELTAVEVQNALGQADDDR